MIRDDEIVVAFCSPNTAKQVPLPDDTCVITGLMPDDEVIVVPRQEFLDWLYEKASSN